MTRTPASGPEAIAEAIEAYLQVRPDAADSLEGIARWWLPGPLQNAPLREVEAAIETLCKRNVLHAERQLTGEVLYRGALPHSSGHDSA